MFLKSRIGCGLQGLTEVLPKYNEKDFVIVHRKNNQGLLKSELYTKGDFEPMEITIAPLSSQIKDCNLMASGHALVTLPKTGRGSHP